MNSSDLSVAGTPDLVTRVKAILISPLTEWERIDTESSTISGVYSSYVLILAAIPPLAQLVRSLVFGFGAIGFSYRPPIVLVLVQAVVGYLISVGMVYVFALIIDALAPKFGGQKNLTQAFKVAAYAATAGWIAGIFAAAPFLSILGLAGLYSLYLLYLGLPRLMKAPQTQALSYTVVTVLAAFVIGVVLSLAYRVVEAPFMAFGGGGMFHAPGQVTGSFQIPGGNPLALAQLDAAAKQTELAAAQIKADQTGQAVQMGQSGAVVAMKPVAPDALKALLPDTLSGYARTEISATGGGVAGMSAANASATYAKGDSNIQLAVSDIGAMGAMAAMAGVTNVESDKETATGYEKVGKVDGRLTTEEYDNQSKHGKYSVIVATRFVVEANGDNVSIDDLKSAVSSVGLDRLEGLAHSG